MHFYKFFSFTPKKILFLIFLNASIQLHSHNGMIKNNRIWISIFGEVYDVTEGENHYGKGGSYQIFAGRDASPCYITGDFDDEGANVGVHTISNKDLVAIDHWRGFYKDSEEYHQVGVLHGNYYDEFGRPTLLLMQTMERLKLGERELTKIKQERARLRAIRKKNLEATKLREKKLSNKKQEL